ncbi:MAG: pyridoxamine 5'-phosphate oxidase [Boseongicola sp.]|nr:MAG: pyridoxamine 5'-phosphate oxidase [Boseongicola sp.]
MAKQANIFAGDNPIAIIRRWQEEAWKTEPNDANAMALATADATGMPNVRMVLLKEIEDDAFVFYTNYESAKGGELDANAQAAFVIHWKTLRRQVRVRGHVSREEGPQADAYYNTRKLESRIGAWASQQSRPLSSRESLMAEVAKLGIKHGLKPERPPHWGGFRIRPVEIELWADGAFRLHDRFRFTRGQSDDPDKRDWQATRLAP